MAKNNKNSKNVQQKQNNAEFAGEMNTNTANKAAQQANQQQNRNK
jgi:hypothetical protein